MRRQGLTALAILGLLVAAALIATQLRVSPTTALAISQKPEDPKTPPAALIPSATQSSPSSVSAKKVADPAFQEWLRLEAKRMDTPAVDVDSSNRAMAKVLQKLTPTQSRQLLDTARAKEGPAGEKILATYLLVQAGPRALTELRQLIASPLTTTGPQEPHSAGEIEAVREKTLRIMALDGLSSRAQTDPAARVALAKAIDEIQDPYIKSYAQERYRRLPRR